MSGAAGIPAVHGGEEVKRQPPRVPGSAGIGAPMRWQVHGQRTLYQSDWVNVEVTDVELPDGRHLDHHVLRMHRQSASAAVLDDQGRVLLLWRHRFITARWGWSCPPAGLSGEERPRPPVARFSRNGWELVRH